MDYLVILLYISFICYTIFIAYISFGMLKIRINKNLNFEKCASIIVPFRNESANLSKCLNSLISQNYPTNQYEIILVNDNSEDNFQPILDYFKSHSNISFLTLRETSGKISRKKAAIDLGINSSRYEFILTTDADCWHDKNWLASMLNSFASDIGFVTGKVEFSNGNSIFNKFQKLEFASLVSIGAALIENNFPILANGACCAYRKQAYYKVNGFNDNYSIISGDEEFLMHKIFLSTYYKIKFCSYPESTVYTQPNKNLNEFINQRTRWSSKIFHYKNKSILYVLPFIYFFHLSLVFLLLLSLTNLIFLVFFFFLFISKCIMDFLFLILSKKLFNLTYLLKYLIFAEFIHIFYITIIPVRGLFFKFNWKGRTLK